MYTLSCSIDGTFACSYDCMILHCWLHNVTTQCEYEWNEWLYYSSPSPSPLACVNIGPCSSLAFHPDSVYFSVLTCKLSAQVLCIQCAYPHTICPWSLESLWWWLAGVFFRRMVCIGPSLYSALVVSPCLAIQGLCVVNSLGILDPYTVYISPSLGYETHQWCVIRCTNVLEHQAICYR